MNHYAPQLQWNTGLLQLLWSDHVYVMYLMPLRKHESDKAQICHRNRMDATLSGTTNETFAISVDPSTMLSCSNCEGKTTPICSAYLWFKYASILLENIQTQSWGSHWTSTMKPVAIATASKQSSTLHLRIKLIFLCSSQFGPKTPTLPARGWWWIVYRHH